VADTLTLPRVIRRWHVDQAKADKINSAGGEKNNTSSAETGNVSLGKPRPLGPPAESNDDLPSRSQTR
jgi:hypothetical protein